MYPRGRRKMLLLWLTSIILSAYRANAAPCRGINATSVEINKDMIENNIIDSGYEIKFESKYGVSPSWSLGDGPQKDSYKYTMINEDLDATKHHKTTNNTKQKTVNEKTKTTDENTTNVKGHLITTNETNRTTAEEVTKTNTTAGNNNEKSDTNVSKNNDKSLNVNKVSKNLTLDDKVSVMPLLKLQNHNFSIQTTAPLFSDKYDTSPKMEPSTGLPAILTTEAVIEITDAPSTKTTLNTLNMTETFNLTERSTESIETNEQNITIEKEKDTDLEDTSVPIYTELDYESDFDVPEDYYDAKDSVPTKPPNTDAFSMLYNIAGSVAETVAERVLPKGIFDLFKRMQKQGEAIEAERLRSREENGGLGQFGRGILKSISSGITRPLSQLMAGVRDIGSLDTDRGFVSGLASGVAGVADGVANVANSVSDAFKDRVQAIFPGTLWCGDGHSAAARSHELGLFFLTDTCCRQHDACKQFIRSGETKHGLTNTGLFTRSHCSCDTNFRNCLQKTNSLVSSQIGLTYFNVLGPQCFRKAYPIIRCLKRTRLTGLKCEEYELDYSKPKMWQWFDSETF